MNKTGLTLSAVLATVGATEVLFPAEVASLFTLDSAVALFALAVSVVAYGIWFGPLRFLSGSRALQLLGFAIFATALASIGSPTLWGLRESYVPIADIILIIETGVLIQLIGLEKKQKNVLSPLAYLNSTKQLLQRRLHRGHAVTPTTHYISR